MVRYVCVVVVAMGCDLSSVEFASEGNLAIQDGESCIIDARTAVGYGFCLDGNVAFAVSGNGGCGDATVWIDPTWSPDNELRSFTLQNQSTDLDIGSATVWVDVEGESYASTSGTATGLLRSDGTVAVSFQAQLETFIGGDPGPTASGLVICDLN